MRIERAEITALINSYVTRRADQSCVIESSPQIIAVVYLPQILNS